MSSDEWGQGPWSGGNGISVASESRVVLREYAGIPIAFQVRTVLDVERADDGFTLTERVFAPTIIKNYDIVWGDGPDSWESSFDLERWGFLVARVG